MLRFNTCVGSCYLLHRVPSESAGVDRCGLLFGCARSSEIMNGANVAIFQSAPLLASVAMFAVYTLAVDKRLTSTVAFPALAWVNVRDLQNMHRTRTRTRTRTHRTHIAHAPHLSHAYVTLSSFTNNFRIVAYTHLLRRVACKVGGPSHSRTCVCVSVCHRHVRVFVCHRSSCAP